MGKFLVRLGTTEAIAQSGGTGSVEVPIGDTYKTTSTDVFDGGRNSKGVMIGNLIRANIRKIELSWKIISNANYVLLASFFADNKFFYAYYYDTDTGTWLTKYFYVGADRSVDTVKNKQIGMTQVGGGVAPEYYENFKLSFIEV